MTLFTSFKPILFLSCDIDDHIVTSGDALFASVVNVVV